MISTVAELIDLFGGPAAYARAVGMTPGAAKQARRRKSLNVRWVKPTAEAAERLGLELTESTIVTVAASGTERTA